MKIILYANRNTGMAVLSYLVAKKHIVSVIHDGDMEVEALCKIYELPVVTLDTMGEFDLFICCHGRKIIEPQYLVPNKFVNIHPCLFKYKGHNPIKRYIDGGDTKGSVESHWLVEEVDGGGVIHQEFFDTAPLTSYAAFYNIALPYYYKCVNATLAKIEKMCYT